MLLELSQGRLHIHTIIPFIHVNLRVLRIVELVIKGVTDKVGYNSYDSFRKVVILRCLEYIT